MMNENAPTPMRRPALWLLLLLPLALLVRLYGITFDHHRHFHPDERAIAEAVGRISLDWNNLQLDPKFYNYGSLPFYVVRAVNDALRPFIPRVNTYDNMMVTGRAVSAVFGVATVALTVLLGVRLFSWPVALLAGFLLAACPLHIQNSHYMTTDVAVAFMVLVAMYRIVCLAERGTLFDFALAGAGVGLAVATKFSAMPLLAPLGIAGLIRLVRGRRVLHTIGGGLLALLCAVVAFGVGEPYAFKTFNPLEIGRSLIEALGAVRTQGLAGAFSVFVRDVVWTPYANSIVEQSGMVRFAGRLPYTNQYASLPKYWYELKQIILWGMGPPLGLAVVWATASRTVSAVRERSAAHLVLLAWVLPFFLISGSFDVKFVRYLLPIYPIVILWAAAWLWDVAQRSRLGRVALWTVTVGTFLSAISFLSIYQRPHTVVTASEWVYNHIPEDSTILTQHWDEGFPFSLPNRPIHRYKIFEMPYYEPDSPKKLQLISTKLAEADYIAFQTKRLYGAITQAVGKFPEKYKLTSNYFYLLFAGDLGYTLIYDHASRPSLFGFEIPILHEDELADESITVYDHPKVLIFKNTGRLSADEIYRKITSELPSKKLTRDDLLLARAGEEGISASGNVTPPIRSGPIALLWFIVVVEALGLIGYAIVYRWIPRPGVYALSKVLGVLLFAYIPWLLASANLASYTRGTLVVTLLALAGVALLVGRGWTQRPERAEWWPTEALFWGSFAFFLGVRAWNPEVFWGEKPMDFAFLNALTRTTTLPPPEPWFAGSTLHYSYFGHYVVATLGKMCHIHPGITFNLGIAVTGALTAAAAFAAGCAMSDRWRVGLVAAAFSVLIGNLSGVREAIGRNWNLNFDYFWATSRVIQETINEYPFWSLLFADLHAHMLVMPFSLSFVTLVLWWLRRHDDAVRLRSFPLLVLLGLCLGAVMVTNTWSTFTYVPLLPFALACTHLAKKRVSGFQISFALLCVLLVLALSQPVVTNQLSAFVTPETVRQLMIGLAGLGAFVLLPTPVVTSVAVVALAVLLYSPYWLDYHPPSSNLGLERDTFANFYDYFNIFGLFLFIGVPFLFAQWRRLLLREGETRLRGSSRLLVALVFLTSLVCLLLTLPYPRLVEWADLREFLHVGRLPSRTFSHHFSILASVRTGLAILAFLGLHLALDRRLAPERRRIALLLSFAFFVTTGVDIVHIWDRMNTVFKFYLESWFLFSIASAAAVYELRRDLIRSPGWRAVWTAGLCLLVAVSVFTAVTGTRGIVVLRRVTTPRPTLDGTAYLPAHEKHDAAAYEWLNENIQGIPVIAEAHGPSYQEFSRVSMNTGLPTVLGWEYHVTQRGQPPSDIARRRVDLQRLYTTEDEGLAASILQKYHIAMIYVGALERRTYAGANLERFKQWPDLLTPVYSNGGVTIFGVNGQFAGAMPVSTIEEVPREPNEEVPVPQSNPGDLRQPRGVALDSAGNIYVADFDNHRVQKFSPDMKLLRFWGEQGNLPKQFKQPCSLTIDQTDTIYVADTWNQRVQVFNTEGEYQREWGGPFFGPRGIAVSPKGKIYMADTGNHRVRRFNLQGREEAITGERGDAPGQFNDPVGIATDANGRVYVADNGNGRLQILSPEGAVEKTFPVQGWATEVFSEPFVTVTPGGTIWVTVPLLKLVRAYDGEGNMLEEINGSMQPNGRFDRAMGIAYDNTRHQLVVSDLAGKVVRLDIPEKLR